MIKFDYHSHTSHSFDCSADIDDMIRRAIELGLTEYAITNHVDFRFPNGGVMQPYDLENGIDSVLDAQKRYAGQIKILLGIEFGLRPDCCEQAAKIAAAYDFDIILGSMHEDYLTGVDFYFPEHYRGRSKQQAYNMYFTSCLQTVRACDSFDVLGHLDYCERYAQGYDDKTLDYKDHHEIIDEI
ncbi:MAG: histidinol-phosphatase HisJ family protein, partial [Defluviitaleaceae bacterium]|nr:histidinol-phosphatase HisJ family protein [Defluviitaleaceae bacterium]